MQSVKSVERHAIAAGLTGSNKEALLAFAEHPLVGSVPIARQLLEGYKTRIPGVAAALSR